MSNNLFYIDSIELFLILSIKLNDGLDVLFNCAIVRNDQIQVKINFC